MQYRRSPGTLDLGRLGQGNWVIGSVGSLDKNISIGFLVDWRGRGAISPGIAELDSF